VRSELVLFNCVPGGAREEYLPRDVVDHMLEWCAAAPGWFAKPVGAAALAAAAGAGGAAAAGADAGDGGGGAAGDAQSQEAQEAERARTE